MGVLLPDANELVNTETGNLNEIRTAQKTIELLRESFPQLEPEILSIIRLELITSYREGFYEGTRFRKLYSPDLQQLQT